VSDFVLEHRETPRGRRLRRNRVRIAFAVAAVEGILVLAGGIPWWAVVLLAAAALAVYVSVRRSGSGEVVQLAWIAAFSQLALVLVPLLATVLVVLAIVLLAIFAVVALIALARDRR
jgi:hypothetical protein